MIRVVFIDGREEEVPPAELDQLLETGTVSRFLRRSGWVDPRCDLIRRNPMNVFGLPERREPMQRLLGSDRPLPLNEAQRFASDEVHGPSMH